MLQLLAFPMHRYAPARQHAFGVDEIVTPLVIVV